MTVLKGHVDFAGLRKRQTYEEIINYLEHGQELIKYPDRTAKFLKDSPYLTQLDGEGMRTLEEQQLGATRQRAKEDMLRELGYKDDGTVSRAQRQATTYAINTPPASSQGSYMDVDDDDDPDDVPESRIRTAIRNLATGATGATGALSSGANTLASDASTLASGAGTLATGAAGALSSTTNTLATGASRALAEGADTFRSDVGMLTRITRHAQQAARQAVLNRGQQLIEGGRSLASRARGSVSKFARNSIREFYAGPYGDLPIPESILRLTSSRAARRQDLLSIGTSQPWAAAAHAVAEDALRERGHHTAAYIHHMTASSSSQRPIQTFEPQVQFPYPMSTPLARPGIASAANSMRQLQDIAIATPVPGASSKAKAQPGPRTAAVPGASSKAKAQPGPRTVEGASSKAKAKPGPRI